MTLTSYGKSKISRIQFDKGCAFFGAALLLKRHAQNESHKYVYIHLVCQAIELISKGLLLTKDYNKYRSKEREFGHDIFSLSEEVLIEFNLNKFRDDMKHDLKLISEKFRHHKFRYSSIHDIFIDPNSIKIDPVIRRLGASVRLAMRHLDRI